MAALTFTSQVDTVLGTIDGMKVVSTLLTTADGGTDPTQFTVAPLTRVIAFTMGVKTSVAAVYTNAFHAIAGTNANQIELHAPASIATSIIEIWSFGY